MESYGLLPPRGLLGGLSAEPFLTLVPLLLLPLLVSFFPTRDSIVKDEDFLGVGATGIMTVTGKVHVPSLCTASCSQQTLPVV